MKRASNHLLRLAVFGSVFLFTMFCSTVYGQAPGNSIASRTAEINGVKLHYWTAGHGTPLILLHWLRGNLVDVEANHPGVS